MKCCGIISGCNDSCIYLWGGICTEPEETIFKLNLDKNDLNILLDLYNLQDKYKIIKINFIKELIK